MDHNDYGTHRCPCDNENQNHAPFISPFIKFCCVRGLASVSLPVSTTDDIGVSICTDQEKIVEDIHVRFIQIYVHTEKTDLSC